MNARRMLEKMPWILLNFSFFFIIHGNCLKGINRPEPCDDFYDYVCFLDDRKIPKFKTRLTDFIEVQKPNITFPSIIQRSLTPIKKLVKFPRLLKWITELEIWDKDYSDEDMYKFYHMDEDQKFERICERLEGINSTTLNKFYNALYSNIEILSVLKPPVAQNNQFFHWLFQTLKNKIIEEVQNSNLKAYNKDALIFEIHATNSFYAFYDLNNITMIQDAKLAYEKEYYYLKSQLSPEDKNSTTAERILRVGAIDAALKATNKYTGFYYSNFLFQAIAANPSNDAFHYFKTIHITTITRSDPKQLDKAVADSVFVTAHEIFHKLYPFGSSEVGHEIYNKALECSEKEIKKLAETDFMKPEKGWYDEEGNIEDVVNILVLRVVMKMVAEKSKNQDELKAAFETLIGGVCKQSKRKNEHILHHNPFELSLNNAIRQYPMFSSLYGCKLGDRMFAKSEKYCKPLGEEINLDEYNIKNLNNTKEVGGFFKDLIETSKQMNFSYGII